jgi:hypothetical protein
MVNLNSGSDGGPLKKFMDRSVVFDLAVLGVLALDAYLLQQAGGTFTSSSITTVPPPSLEIFAAQATAAIIILKLVNAYVDEEE